MSTKVVSFTDVPAAEAPASAPAADASTAVVPAQSSAPALYEGAQDDGYDSGDINLPKLVLLQGTHEKKLLSEFGFGSLLFKDQIVLAKMADDKNPAKTATLVFVKLISKTYAEKLAKFGTKGGYARSLAEVDTQGGTTDWRESKENPRSGSTKPWYQTIANTLVLVEKPEDAADDHFPFEANGKFYAPALYSVKSFAYDRFFKEIATAKATGELRKEGFSSRFVLFTPQVEAGKGNAEFAVPSIKFGGVTSMEVRNIAAQFA